MCWRLVACDGKGARSSAVPAQSPTSCFKSSRRKRSGAAGRLRGNGICLQRFNLKISSCGMFLASLWPCAGTSDPQDGKVPQGVWKPLKRLSKLHPFYAMKRETQKSLEGSAPAPLPLKWCLPLTWHLCSFIFPFLTFHSFSPSSSTQTLHINSPGPILIWRNTLKLDGWCYQEHRSFFPSHLALLSDFYCYCFFCWGHTSPSGTSNGLRNKGMRPFSQQKPVNKQFGLAINGQSL